MSDAPGSRAGTVFGPYLPQTALGRGGMGEVYEAEHTVKEWTVARQADVGVTSARTRCFASG